MLLVAMGTCAFWPCLLGHKNPQISKEAVLSLKVNFEHVVLISQSHLQIHVADKVW